MTTQPTHCPILADTTRIKHLAFDMKRTMQKLRRDLRTCEDCVAGENCAILQDYQITITDAIAGVLQEMEYFPHVNTTTKEPF